MPPFWLVFTMLTGWLLRDAQETVLAAGEVKMFRVITSVVSKRSSPRIFKFLCVVLIEIVKSYGVRLSSTRRDCSLRSIIAQ